MAEPWYDPQTAMVWGNNILAFSGAFFGVVGGGIGGSLAGQGKGRRWMLPFIAAFGAIGVLMLIYGLFALIAGQPRGIWYYPLLGGVLFGILGCGGYFVMRARYDEAERRKVEAEAIRAG